MKAFDELASDDQLNIAVASCRNNGIHALLTENGDQAKETVLAMLPAHAEVYVVTSVTLDTIGLSAVIDESDKYESVRKKLASMDPKSQKDAMRRIGAAPTWAIGSVHAATEDGHLLIASKTGSQLAAEVYGAGRVIFVIGSQKIVTDNNEGIQRIYEYTLPLEDERARKAYGVPSFVSKLLIINREVNPERITAIFVKQKLGF